MTTTDTLSEEIRPVLEGSARFMIANLALATIDKATWYDVAQHFTCTEADAIATVLCILGHHEASVELLAGHQDTDEEGDLHFTGDDHDREHEHTDPRPDLDPDYERPSNVRAIG